MTGGVKSKLISAPSSLLLLNLQSHVGDLPAAVSIDIADVQSDRNSALH
jgi:hypothetical protein